MDNSLKQRIVGAIVLIGLAIIFLPSILKEKNQQKSFVSEIPEKPTVLVGDPDKALPQEKHQEISNKLDSLAASDRKSKFAQQTDPDAENPSTAQPQNVPKDEETSAQTAKPASQPTNKTATKLNTNGTADEAFRSASWLIKVASFTNLDNAKRLVLKLKEAGFKAYRRDGKTSEGKAIFRVYVGPYIEKSRAGKEIEKVSAIANTKAMLIPFDPIKH